MVESFARNANPCYPFKNMLEFRLRALFDGDDRMTSRVQKEKIWQLVEDVVKIVRADLNVAVPSLDWILNYHKSPNNKIPAIKTTMVKKKLSIRTERGQTKSHTSSFCISHQRS